jgi:hypothetical protein
LGAIHPGHAHVGDHNVKWGLSHGLQGFGAAVGECDFPLCAHAAQAVLDALQNHGFIIDK